MTLTPVPTLAEIVTTPERLSGLPARALAGLLIELASVQAQLGAALSLAPAAGATTGLHEDRVLTIDEAAATLAIEPRTMRRYLRRPPYNAAAIVLSRTVVRVSAQRLDDILRAEGVKRCGGKARSTQGVRVSGFTGTPAAIAGNR